MQKLYIKTYGCQMNVYDSGRMADLLAPHGYETTQNPEEAHVAILNTCHIREKAEQKVFSDLGRLHIIQKQRDTKNPLTIGVGGCVGQAEGDEITKQAPYVSMVFGPQTYHHLPEMLTRLNRDKHVIHTEFPVESKFDYLEAPVASSASAYVSVQEGCDKFCTFCVVPYTRGAEYSRPASAIITEVQQLVDQGVKEITLLGQNVNAYHGTAPDSTAEWGLGRLILALAEIDGLKRLRYTTSHPLDMDDDLIAAHRDVAILMPFLHLPVQSGSDSILKRMNRRHTVAHYLGIIDKIRQARPDMAFSSDFIVGFPGETDQDHQLTCELAKTVGYAQAYSFKYSIRPGTPAGVMDPQVPESVKVERLAELQSLLNEDQLAFNQQTIGTVQTVLLDKQGKKEGQIAGKTPYMQSVYFPQEDMNMGDFVDVLIEKAYANSLTGYVNGSAGYVNNLAGSVNDLAIRPDRFVIA